MRKLETWMLVGLVLAAGACGSREKLPPVGAAASATTAEDCDRLFGERVNAGDVEGVVALYEPDATLVRQDGASATGTDAIRAEITALVASHPHITMHVTKVVRGGADIAVLYNDFIATGIDANAQPTTLAGGASEVVRKQHDGSWRFVIDDPYARGAH
ncbi:MAG: YybH family protein [Solirubrobacteraceae bacterium]